MKYYLVLIAALISSGVAEVKSQQNDSLRSGTPGRHGTLSLTEEVSIRSDSPGKFGRLFPSLVPFLPAVEDLRTLAAAMKDDANNGGDSGTPAIYTYFGQFLDHDLSLDPAPLSTSLSDPAQVKSLRSPELSLDSLYGLGQAGSPQLFQRTNPDLFQIGMTSGNKPEDLLRVASGLAVLGDPRNDENLIVAQLHLIFQKLHNKVVAQIGPQNPTARSTFELARETVLWHYQWIVINDFLRRVLDTQALDRTIISGPKYFKPTQGVFIPLEFSGAAYRFGHSMVRETYHFSDNFPNATIGQLFSFTGGGGGAPIPDIWIIDWKRLTNTHADATQANFARKIDAYVVPPLHTLNLPDERSLPARNMIRGRRLGLPSGQDVAKAIGVAPLSAQQIETSGTDGNVAKQLGFTVASPLWYYVLKEAQIIGKGERLGPVGSTIVAETIIGLLLADRDSFLTNNPNWQPTLKMSDGTPVNTLINLIRFTAGI